MPDAKRKTTERGQYYQPPTQELTQAGLSCKKWESWYGQKLLGHFSYLRVEEGNFTQRHKP